MIGLASRNCVMPYKTPTIVPRPVPHFTEPQYDSITLLTLKTVASNRSLPEVSKE